jgi:hypothetical protein
MKQILTFGFVTFLLLSSCQYGGEKATGIQVAIDNDMVTTPLVLPASLENRRPEFETNVKNAIANIKTFATKYGWDSLTIDPFMDSIMIFDNKKKFDRSLLTLVQADTCMELPVMYCAALEERTLVVVTPEQYAEAYPEGIEADSYEKLLTHEIAHRLHIRILNGDEEAMGPVWFYEGFALFAADQFSTSSLQLSEEEIKEIMNNPDRGSYVNYNFIFRYFASRIPLKELIAQARNENFNEWVYESSTRN